MEGKDHRIRLNDEELEFLVQTLDEDGYSVQGVYRPDDMTLEEWEFGHGLLNRFSAVLNKTYARRDSATYP